MRNRHGLDAVLGGVLSLCLLVVGACSPIDGGNDNDNQNQNDNGGGDPAGFTNADASRGGTMYDKWWVVAGVDAPTDDHALWSTQDTNTRSGADTWRCKECHGWDYKGLNGAYADGSSHFTGFTGLFGTTLSAQAVFDKIKDGHGFGGAGLSDDDIWDLAKFVLEGQIDTDDVISGSAFTGDANSGMILYEDGIGTNTACAGCHGADGLAAPPGVDPADHADFVGLIANENPWEFQHKVRFGQPGTAMPAASKVNATNDDVADLGAYAQTLPTSPDPTEFTNADANRGGTMYDKWWVVTGADAPTGDHALWSIQDTNTRSGVDTWRCKECHGWDYKGLNGAYADGSSHFTGIKGLFGTTLSAQEVFDKIKGFHGFGDAGLSDDDIWDLAKFVLEGQIDTDDIIDAAGAFGGDAGNGMTLFDDGIGGNTACAICHGNDGLTAPPGADAATYDDWVGLIANENPWEFQHKVRFGQPGTAMPAAGKVNATNDDVADLGTYAQTLPEGP